MKKHCLHCGVEFTGRTDKRFCSVSCKNHYNFQKRKDTKDEVHLNKEGKTYHLVYDYAWMDFTNQSVLVVRKTGDTKK